jgi:hypothetical protein
MTTKHDCVFLEVVIEESDEDDNLKAGMKVLIPCECGETPLDHLGMVEMHMREATEAISSMQPTAALYHWAPTSRRKQIVRYGLRPYMRPTTSSDDYRAPLICLGVTPSWAWALSGGMSWTPEGEWDLWQTYMDCLTEPTILPSVQHTSGIHEVRTEHRIYKRDLWYVASRVK